MYQTVFLKISCFIIACGLISCKSNTLQNNLPYYNTPQFTPQFFKTEKDAEQKVNHTITTFSMLDQNGKTITDKNIDGKIHVANFIFTSCGSICPIMTNNLKLVQQNFKNDTNVVILSFSVTPCIDNVPKLKKYADNNEITAPNWHLLTGDKAEIYTLARKAYFAEEDLGFTKDSTDFLHTEHILLVDKTKRIRGIYNGTLQLEMEQLVKDIAVLEND